MTGDTPSRWHKNTLNQIMGIYNISSRRTQPQSEKNSHSHHNTMIYMDINHPSCFTHSSAIGYTNLFSP